MRVFRYCRILLFWLPAFVLAACAELPAQIVSPTTTGSLTGTVSDPTGAVIPGASISLSRSGHAGVVVKSDGVGNFSISRLAPGTWELEAGAAGFRTAQQTVLVKAGAVANVTLTLAIETEKQQVVVSADALDTSPGNNGGAIVMKGEDLKALSDDPDELSEQLQAIAGGDPDSGGSQLYVDGFSAGKLPPKSAIREIRINQNPFSAQYDSLGWGRIEILTKPGSDKLHGDYWMQGNNSPWNARNPFVTTQPPYYSYSFDGDFDGPISKNASYFVSFYGQNAVNDSIINAEILNGSLDPVAFTQALTTPASNVSISPRFDFQWGKVHTISVRYQYSREAATNSGIGQFELASQGYNSSNVEQYIQLIDSQAWSPRVLNEIHFQYVRDRNSQTPKSSAPTIAVQGAFTGGGSNAGTNRDNQDHYEFQDLLRLARGHHDITLGGRLRATRDANFSLGNFNGLYTFASLSAYQITVRGLASGMSPAAIRAAGGGASLFSQTEGTPAVVASVLDAGVFAEDNWKASPNTTISYGMRFETQSDINDHADFGPRLGIAWSIPGAKNKPPRAVLRAGAGIFYNRFDANAVLQSRRQNGVREREVVISNPDFYPAVCSTDAAACNEVPQDAPAIYQVNRWLRAPFNVIASVGMDKPLGKYVSLSVNYLFSRGEHQFLTENINAPLPGTYDPADPTSGVRPLGTDQNIYQYNSGGDWLSQRLTINGSVHSKKVGIWGFYRLAKVQADTAGLGSFPSDQYDPHLDWGRASWDQRNRGNLGGFTRLPLGFTLNPFLIVQSGRPFNIVVGQDLNGDTQFNDRPAFATDLSRPSVFQTKWGAFDTSPMPGEKIVPINYGKGPGLFIVNLRLNRSFNFGPPLPETPTPAALGAAKPAQPVPKPGVKLPRKEIERKYMWGVGIGVQNLLNHPNLAQPVGVLGSPLFGRSTALTGAWGNSADRAVMVETFFRF